MFFAHYREELLLAFAELSRRCRERRDGRMADELDRLIAAARAGS